jgi:hypothetical protein
VITDPCGLKIIRPDVLQNLRVEGRNPGWEAWGSDLLAAEKDDCGDEGRAAEKKGWSWVSCRPVVQGPFSDAPRPSRPPTQT